MNCFSHHFFNMWGRCFHCRRFGRCHCLLDFLIRPVGKMDHLPGKFHSHFVDLFPKTASFAFHVIPDPVFCFLFQVGIIHYRFENFSCGHNRRENVPSPFLLQSSLMACFCCSSNIICRTLRCRCSAVFSRNSCF